MASSAMPFILPITVPLADIEIWLVRRFQLVFLNLPETREERVRRDEQEKAERRRKEEREEEERRRMEEYATFSAWYARLQEAHEKGESFDEPPPWE